MAPPQAQRTMRAMALDDDEESYSRKPPQGPPQSSSLGFSSTSQSGFHDNSTLMMSSTSSGTIYPSTQTSPPLAHSSREPVQKSLNVPLPTAETGEFDQDNKDAPGGDGPDLGVVNEPTVTMFRSGTSPNKGKSLRAKSLMDEEKELPLMPPNPMRDLQMEIEEIRKQKQALHRENNELRSRIKGSNVSCPSRALHMHANNVERSTMKSVREGLCRTVPKAREEALSAELQEAIIGVSEGSFPVQDYAFAALAPAELTAHARLVQPRFSWVLNQLCQFLKASGFQVDLQISEVSERDGVDTCFLGDILHACFVLEVKTSEDLYAAALLLARAPVMARVGTRWVGVVDRLCDADPDAPGDLCMSVAIDGHVAEVRLCSRQIEGAGKWSSRAADAEAVLMGAMENFSAGRITPHSEAAVSALSRMIEMADKQSQSMKPVCDRHGLQAIHYAALHGNHPLLEKLVHIGADLFAQDKEGHFPLHRAVMCRHLEVASWLLDRMLEGAKTKRLDLVAKRKLVELWQWAIHAGGQEGHLIEGLPTVPWSTVRKLTQLAQILGADTIELTAGGRNAADYVAEFGDPVFLATVTNELKIAPRAYATDGGCASGIRSGHRGLLLTMPIRRIDWSGTKSMGRERPLSDFAGYLCRNRGLEELVMWECGLEVPGASALFSALSVNCALRRLDLMRNPGIGSASAMKVLGSSLRDNQTLEELVLRACEISAAGVAFLCSGLAENRSIRRLNLRENKDVGTLDAISAISACLSQNGTLQELDLWECGITSDSVTWLYDGLARNQGLKMLALVGNRGLGQHAAIEELKSCMQKNSTLESLLMSGCSVKPGSIDDPRVQLY